MKQRITPEQLLELTDEQKDKLREWWNPQKGDFCCSTAGMGSELLFVELGEKHNLEIKKCSLPLLSIGQMIELLLSAGGPHMLNFMERCIKTRSFRADKLWQAVKEVL